MKLQVGLGPATVGFAVVTCLVGASVATAQQTPPAGMGEVVGAVARCEVSGEQPAAQVAVGIDDGEADLASTDATGSFAMALEPGEYTIVATAADGTTASRDYVPVAADQVLDIGVLDLGTGLIGCGPDSDVAPAVAAPSVTPTTPPRLPTITPTAVDEASGGT
jgi:hypothetical protein